MENILPLIGSALSGGTLAGLFVFWYLKRTVTRRDSKRDKLDEKREQQQDELDALHDANRGKEIDADAEAFRIIADRLHDYEERTDAKIEHLQTALTTHMVLAARKDAKIEQLEKENLAKDVLIATLRREVQELRCALDALKQQVMVTLEAADNPVHAVIDLDK